MHIDTRESIQLRLGSSREGTDQVARLEVATNTDGTKWAYICLPCNKSWSSFHIWLPDNTNLDSAQALVDAFNNLRLDSATPPDMEKERQIASATQEPPTTEVDPF